MPTKEWVLETRKRLSNSKYKPDEEGVWRIKGEDPNCDLGGHHHNPHLDTVSGRYCDVVEHALSLDRFWSWGYGGDIEKLSIQEVPKYPKERRAIALKDAITTKMEEISKQERELAVLTSELDRLLNKE